MKSQAETLFVEVVTLIQLILNERAILCLAFTTMNLETLS